MKNSKGIQLMEKMKIERLLYNYIMIYNSDEDIDELYEIFENVKTKIEDNKKINNN